MHSTIHVSSNYRSAYLRVAALANVVCLSIIARADDIPMAHAGHALTTSTMHSSHSYHNCDLSYIVISQSYNLMADPLDPTIVDEIIGMLKSRQDPDSQLIRLLLWATIMNPDIRSQLCALIGDDSPELRDSRGREPFVRAMLSVYTEKEIDKRIKELEEISNREQLPVTQDPASPLLTIRSYAMSGIASFYMLSQATRETIYQQWRVDDRVEGDDENQGLCIMYLLLWILEPNKHLRETYLLPEMYFRLGHLDYINKRTKWRYVLQQACSGMTDEQQSERSSELGLLEQQEKRKVEYTDKQKAYLEKMRTERLERENRKRRE